MLQTLKTNMNNTNPCASLFEIATIYIKTNNELPDEKQTLVIGSYGEFKDFYEFKSIITTLLDNLDVKPYTFKICDNNPSYHPFQSANLVIRGKQSGVFGRLNPKIAKNFDIKAPVFIAEIDFDMLFECRGRGRRHEEISKFPKISRDLAFLVDKSELVGDILQDIKSVKSPIFESVEFFDIYEGDNLPENKKSIAFSLTFGDKTRTLKEEEASEVTIRIIDKIKHKYKAELRG